MASEVKVAVYEDNAGHLTLVVCADSQSSDPSVFYDMTPVASAGTGMDDMMLAYYGQHGEAAGWTVGILDDLDPAHQEGELVATVEGRLGDKDLALLLFPERMGRAAKSYFNLEDWR